jgi:hypothetical protein
MSQSPKHVVAVTVLALTALITGGGGLFLWLRLGNNAAPPALLGASISLTCVMRIITLTR